MVSFITTVGCFFHYKDEFVVLLRVPNDTQGGKWGLPASIVRKGESYKEAMVRAIKEELGLDITQEHLEFLDAWTWNFPEISVTFPSFRVRFDSRPKIRIDPSKHTKYKWLTAKEYYAMSEKEVVHGIHDLLRYAKYV